MAAFRQEWMTCRFCGQSAHVARMVKYGVRHYAHQDCYLDRHGLNGLHAWQVGHLSLKALEARGLMEQAARIVADARDKP